MDKYYRIWKGRLQPVSGKKVTEHFGICLEVGQGWQITHLPSGCLLTTANFLSEKDATKLAESVEAVFGSHLDRPKDDAILVSMDQVPGGVKMHDLLVVLGQVEGPISMEDVENESRELETVCNVAK